MHECTAFLFIFGFQFHVPQTMTKFDIKNYLQNIYKVCPFFFSIPFPVFLPSRTYLPHILGFFCGISCAQIDVEKVNTLNVLGKTKRDHMTRKPYKRPDYKKAYVYLANQTFEVWNTYITCVRILSRMIRTE